MTCQNMFYRPISELDNQAGYADSLGYEAYMELLDEVLKEKQLQKDAVADK